MRFNPYSPSRLDVATCGYSFFNEYAQAERIKRESIPSARGSVVHEVLEIITKEMLAGRVAFDPNVVRKYISDSVTRHPAAYAQMSEIIGMVNLYINKPIPFPWKDIRTEQKLAVKKAPATSLLTIGEGEWDECHYDDPAAIVRGRIDIMCVSDDGLSAIIYDHKTQFNPEDADTFQMGVYAWMTWRTYPFLKSISTVMHFPRWGCYSEMFTWTPEMLLNVENELLAKIDVIESRQEWGATGHKGCNYCHFIATCPLVRQYIELDEAGGYRVKDDNFKILGSTHKAVKLAELKNIIDVMGSRINDELRAHVEFSGPVAIPGVIFEYRGEEKIDYDYASKKQKAEFIKICQEHGEDPFVHMGITATHSKSIWKSGKEELVKALSKLFKRKTATTFKGWKS